MKIRCRRGTVYSLSSHLTGKKIKCKKCSFVFEMPSEPKATQPTPQPVDSGLSKKIQRENELLAKYMQNDTTTLDQRIARRQRDATESERIPSVVKHILIALACFAAAFICGFVLSALENGGIAPRIVWPFVWLGGKYWVPPLLVIPGLFNLYLAFWFLTRKSNIDG